MMPFDSLAQSYERFRPRSPCALFAEFARACTGSGQAPRAVIDVGCGTGISTRALREAFGPTSMILGIEPSAGMLAEAIASSRGDHVRIHNAQAEELPVVDGAVDVVFAAQAVQWFDRPVFFDEAGRVLRPGVGMVGICQNNRNWRESPLLETYEQLLERYSPGYARDYRSIDVEGELRALTWTSDVYVAKERWEFDVTVEDFIGFAFSSTKTQGAAATHGRERVREAVHDIALDHAVEGRVVIPYVCELYSARKR